VEHQHLPPAVGLRAFDQLRRDVGKALHVIVPYQLADELVVLLGGRVEPVRTLRIVRVAVVGAGDEGDPEARFGGGIGHSGSRLEVILGR